MRSADYIRSRTRHRSRVLDTVFAINLPEFVLGRADFASAAGGGADGRGR